MTKRLSNKQLADVAQTVITLSMEIRGFTFQRALAEVVRELGVSQFSKRSGIERSKLTRALKKMESFSGVQLSLLNDICDCLGLDLVLSVSISDKKRKRVKK